MTNGTSPLDSLRRETQKHVQTLIESALLLQRCPDALEPLDECSNAASAIRAASLSAGLQATSDLAHVIETWFAHARECEVALRPEQIDLMAHCADLLDRFAKLSRDMEHAVRAVRRSPPGRNPARAQADDGCGSKRVLVMDKSSEIRELERRLLGYRGYDVEIAATGTDGWTAIQSGTFDLVLVDIDMPLIDGIELTVLIRADERYRSLPVLVVCDDDSESTRRRLFEAGADYYVIKGKFEEQLAQTVASLIGPAKS